jgi:hypothetical protein
VDSIDTRRTRIVGAILYGVFANAAGVLYILGQPGWAVAALPVALAGLLALTLPRAWMRVGHAVGRVVTAVLLALVFVLVVCPLALVMRLVGRDALRLRGRSESYWEPKAPPRGARSYFDAF